METISWKSLASYRKLSTNCQTSTLIFQTVLNQCLPNFSIVVMDEAQPVQWPLLRHLPRQSSLSPACGPWHRRPELPREGATMICGYLKNDDMWWLNNGSRGIYGVYLWTNLHHWLKSMSVHQQNVPWKFEQSIQSEPWTWQTLFKGVKPSWT